MKKHNSATALLLLFLPALVAAQAYDGLTLANNMSSRTMRLITNDGQAVKTWTCNSNVAYMPYLMPDSTVWRPGVYSGATLRPAAYGGLIERYNWNGDVVQSFSWSGPDHIQHHDIQPMPNGNVLIVSIDRWTRAEAQAMGRVNISASHIWSEKIVEYDPVADSVVWEWRFWDHLVQNVDSLKPNYGVISEHPHRLNINAGTVQTSGDWIHLNAVDYWEEEDLLVVCSHCLNELYVIDHSTTTEEARGSTGGRHGKGGDFLHRWGNPQIYGRGTAADQRFFVVHGANFIRPGLEGGGNVMVINNGDRPGSSNDYSSIEEIVLPRDSLGRFYIHPDSAFGPTEPVWLYSNPGVFYSNHLGGAFRLPNGNTVISEGTRSRLFEVTPGGTVVWTYNTGGQIGRAQKYPRDFSVGVVEESPKCEVRSAPHQPTIVRGVLHLRPSPFPLPAGEGPGVREWSLLDASGRRVMELQPGPNDLRRLPAGVYFVTGASTAASRFVKGE
ncbi:arylsulfotransferase (ASST) [candidate division WOR-3 bacterium]|nr:arylsulfotransferase (ASST) [candidate division WOR-3 bacterium]